MSRDPSSHVSNHAQLYRFGVTLAATLGLVACGARPSDIVVTTEAYGQATCPNTPDATFMGEIAVPDVITESLQQLVSDFSTVGYITPQTYNNHNCSWSSVVKITGWLDPLADFAIVPNAKPSPLTSKAACEALLLAATVYPGSGVIGQTLVPVPSISRQASGVFSSHVDSFGLTHTWCTPPTLIFGGSTWREGDFDEFASGATYTFAATYRTNAGGPVTTAAMSMFNAKPICGHATQACCTANASFIGDGNPWCEGYNRCDNGTCAPCGGLGQEWCGNSANKICNAENIQPLGSICAACGAVGQDCCRNPNYPKAPLCANNLSCGGGKCHDAPPPIAPPPPTVSGPPRCNGKAATALSQLHTVLVQDAGGCGGVFAYRADSDAEAQACAKAAGNTVLTGSQTLQDYTFCICSEYGGASAINVQAYAENAASTCALETDLNAKVVWPGDCTSDEEAACE